MSIYVLVVGGLEAVGAAFGLTDTATSRFSMGYSITTADGPAAALFGLVSAIVGIYGGYWLLTRYLAARGRFDGEGRFWAYLGMAILSVIGIGVGVVLLVVPGLILLVRWSAASGFVIGSRQGVSDSLTASWHATKGHGWAIFGAGFVLLFGAGILSAIIGAATFVMGTTTANVASAFVETATTAIFMALGIAVYSVLDQNAETLGEVFA